MQLLPHGNSNIVGNAGGPYTTYKGSQNVHIDELHNNLVNELFNNHVGVSTTISVASNIGDTQLQVISAASFAVNDVLEIHNGITETTFPLITSLPGGNVIVLDRPLDFAYAIGDTVDKVHTDLTTVVGSLSSPIIHRINPDPGETWYVNRILLSMTHSGAASDDKFGDLSALPFGMALRVNINGQLRTLTNWKTNRDMILDMFDVNYSDKAGPSLFGTSGRGSFSRVGVLIKLNGDKGDYMDVLVQDDLTGLNSFFINAQGYIE